MPDYIGNAPTTDKSLKGTAIVVHDNTNTFTLNGNQLVLPTISIGGTLTAQRLVYFPAALNAYIVSNQTTWPINATTVSGTGVIVAAGQTVILRCDGTNIVLVSSTNAEYYADEAAGSTSDVKTANYTVQNPVLGDGYRLTLGVTNSNLTYSPTFAPVLNGVTQTARQMVKYVGNAAGSLAPLDLQGDMDLRYDAINLVWIVMNPASVDILTTGRNVIVNGGCEVSQVNGTTQVTPVNTQYPIDNVKYFQSQASHLQTTQVYGVLGSLGAVTSLTVSVVSAYSPLSTDYFSIAFPIEGLNFARFQYGTANAKAGSLQFKTRASVAGTYSGSLTNYAANRSYPFTYVIPVANTDTLITIPNIPGDTGGTWVGATNAGAAYLYFDLGTGTNGKSTANSWQAGNYSGVTGTTNLVSQVNSSTLTITDVQFEVGAFCTQYERKLYDQVLRECQRYLQVFIMPLSWLYAPSAIAVYQNIPNITPLRIPATGAIVSSQTYVNASALAWTATAQSSPYVTRFTWNATAAGQTYAFDGSIILTGAQI